VNSRGKRYSHQRRLTRTALETANTVLSDRAKRVWGARDFDQLFNIVDAAVDDIPGLGELYVYDTALRIGAKLNLFPARVYLHAGTRQGARAQGEDARADALDMADLPREFHVLKPMKSETCGASSRVISLPLGKPLVWPPGEVGARSEFTARDTFYYVRFSY
jgi:hypothetical protein